jgi:endonuclease III
MSDISQNDIESFGKVLIALGEVIKGNPKIVLDFINSAQISDFNRIKSFNLYELAKDKTKDELICQLKQFDVAELRYLIKELRLGGTKAKSISSLSEYIADQAKKRTTDVFQNQ